MSNVVYEPSKTTHWRNLFESKTMLLGSHNLNDGEELIGQIANVSVQKIKGRKGEDQTVPVINFFNAPPMVLNITNTQTIASIYGDNYKGWEGKYIQIYATKVKAFGTEQMALRIRPTEPTTGYDLTQYQEALNQCKSMDDLKDVWLKIPKQLKPALEQIKNQVKGALNA